MNRFCRQVPGRRSNHGWPRAITRALLPSLLLLPCLAKAQPYGIAERVPNTALVITETPASVPEPHVAVRLFPNVTVPGAAKVLAVPSSEELIIVSPTGLWPIMRNDPNTEVGDSWIHLMGDAEVLDMAFLPGWTAGDEFVVTLFDENQVIVAKYRQGEFVANLLLIPNAVRSAASGSLVYTDTQTLLLGLGDFGMSSTVGATDALHGSILHLDPETLQVVSRFATGFRLPRLARDPFMETVFATDHVDAGPLEINRVGPNLHFGWPHMAGNVCYPTGSTCSSIGRTRPTHTSAVNGTAGYVGGQFSYDRDAPDLHGLFVLANSATGEVGAIRDTGALGVPLIPLVTFPPDTITGTGVDAEGVVYIISNGGLYVLRPEDGVPNSFPTRLSDIPALLAAGHGTDQTDLGIIPYRPSATLWTDNARKERFIALPGTSQIGFRERDGWEFPESGLVVKNFIMPVDEREGSYQERRLETRLMFHLNGQWNGFSYRWNEDENDAILLPRELNRPVPIVEETGSTLDYSWFYPSRTDCFLCHTGAANFVLGLNTAQMNFEITYPATGVTDNQLRAMDHVSIFSEPLPAPPNELERIPDQHDVTASLNSRARAFLHANCAFCHRHGGGGQVGTDFLWTTPLEAMGILNERPSGFDLDIEDAYLLLPGHPEKSVLAARMESLNTAYQMPPIGRSRVAEADLALIRDWITSLEITDQWIMF